MTYNDHAVQLAAKHYHEMTAELVAYEIANPGKMNEEYYRLSGMRHMAYVIMREIQYAGRDVTAHA